MRMTSAMREADKKLNSVHKQKRTDMKERDISTITFDEFVKRLMRISPPKLIGK